MSEPTEADEMFVAATNNESGLTFEQIMERLDDIGYWRKAGLTECTRAEQRKHTRAKLRSLHNEGFAVFSAFRGKPQKQSNAAAQKPGTFESQTKTTRKLDESYKRGVEQKMSGKKKGIKK
ncbi:MAG: hypothetical protein NVSMB56_01810 [Pyrinomonadaceae bacterium]